MLKALVVLLALTSVAVAETKSSEKLDKLAKPFIMVNNGGSGFVIKHDDTRTFVLTAAHCLDEENAVRFFEFDEHGKIITKIEKEATIETKDIVIDYAILSVKGKFGEPAVISKASPSVFDTVFTLGAPDSQVWARQGIVSSLTNVLSPNTDKIQRNKIGYDAGVWYGASGSALCNEQLEVIGVVTQINAKDFERIEQMGYAVPMTIIMGDLTVDEVKKFFGISERQLFVGK